MGDWAVEPVPPRKSAAILTLAEGSCAGSDGEAGNRVRRVAVDAEVETEVDEVEGEADETEVEAMGDVATDAVVSETRFAAESSVRAIGCARESCGEDSLGLDRPKHQAKDLVTRDGIEISGEPANTGGVQDARRLPCRLAPDLRESPDTCRFTFRAGHRPD